MLFHSTSHWSHKTQRKHLWFFNSRALKLFSGTWTLPCWLIFFYLFDHLYLAYHVESEFPWQKTSMKNKPRKNPTTEEKQTKPQKVVIATCLLAISEHFPGLLQYIHRKGERPILPSWLETQARPVNGSDRYHTKVLQLHLRELFSLWQEAATLWHKRSLHSGRRQDDIIHSHWKRRISIKKIKRLSGSPHNKLLGFVPTSFHLTG